MFKEKINEFHKYIEEDRQAKEIDHETKLQELKVLEDSIQANFDMEMIARRDMEKRVL